MARSCWLIATLAVAASCRDKPSNQVFSSDPRSVTPSSPCGEMSCVDLGRAHELGTGRPRDYHAAAAAYRRGCDADEAVACRHVADTIMHMRSNEPMEAADTAYERACTLGDAVACWQLSQRDPSVPAGDSEAEKAADEAYAASLLPRLAEACQHGDVTACELVPCQECDCDEERCGVAKQRRDLALCLKGASQSCISVAVNECNFDERCIAELPRSANADVRAAVAYMTKGCSAGDPDLCVALLRPIANDELCAAHDRSACSAAEREREKAAK